METETKKGQKINAMLFCKTAWEGSGRLMCNNECEHKKKLTIYRVESNGSRVINNYICEDCYIFLDVCLNDKSSICSEACSCKIQVITDYAPLEKNILAPWQEQLLQLKV